jgi:translation initiation factor IF-2
VPTRIYALAKELNVDSKELVEICSKAGVTGKGSALASLTDDEVSKVKSFLNTGHRPASGPKGKLDRPTRAPSRDHTIKQFGPTRSKPEVRPVRESAGVGARPPETRHAVEDTPEIASPAAHDMTAPAAEEPLSAHAGVEEAPAAQESLHAEEAAATATAVAEPDAFDMDAEEADAMQAASEALAETPEETAATEIRPTEEFAGPAAATPAAAPSQPAPPAPRRDEPVRGPSPLAGKVRVVGSKSKKDEGKGGDADRGKPSRPIKKKRGPVIHLASVPESKPPRTQPPKEEKAQKPIMRLPQDTIRDVKSGKKDAAAPLQQLAERVKEKKEGKRPAKTGVFAEEDAAARAKARRGKGGKAEEGESDIADMADVRQRRRKDKKKKRSEDEEGAEARRPKQLVRQHRGVSTAAPRKGKVTLELPCTIRTFSEAAGVPAAQVLRTLIGMGMPVASVNVQLDPDVAQTLALELGVDLEFKQQASLEDTLLQELDQVDGETEKLKSRPPVVTFLGHVDHGKTSLLDAIIGTNVVAGEAGGITQHIRAYEIKKDDRSIAFVDTPGHEAFTEMRARGANVTDIAVLVIAADDGIMPQTEEAISHARAAGVPIVVALNKIDLPGADANKVMQQLAAHELLPSEWGGNVEVVKTSAIKKEGIDELLETLLTIAELNEFTADPERKAVGVCLEAEQEAGRGVIAKLIVKQGTLHPGDVIVCGDAHGRVKAMFDTLRAGKKRKKAGPSIPVNITGLDKAPSAGEKFYVLDDIAQAREIAASREQRTRAKELEGRSKKVSFEDFSRLVSEGRFGKTEEVVELRLLLRADTRGSIEAIQKELEKFKEHKEVRIRLLHIGVGAVTEGDVTLAEASDAVVVAFNVIPDENARRRAEEHGVEIRRYDIIYKVTDDIRAMLEGKLKPEERQVELGRAFVQRVFNVSRIGTIAGCRVMQGVIERNARIRVFREGRNIGEYPIESLKHLKDDVREVPRGMECGIKLSGFNDIKPEDLLEAYKIEEVARTLT